VRCQPRDHSKGRLSRVMDAGAAKRFVDNCNGRTVIGEGPGQRSDSTYLSEIEALAGAQVVNDLDT
jgi:hypothetical protein